MVSIIQEAFGLEKMFLKISGFHPGKTIFLVLALCNLTIGITQFSTMFTELYFSLDNLKRVSDISLFCVTEFSFIIKMINFLIHRKSFIALEQFISDPILNNIDMLQTELLKDGLKNCQLIGRLFRYGCVFSVFGYGVSPFLDKEAGLSLPLPGRFPYNTENYFIETYIGQMLSLVVGAYTNSTLDILAYTIMNIAKMEFIVLNDNLLNILKDGSSPREQIIKCIKHHTAVIKFVNLTEETFNIGVFAQFSGSVIVICMTGFQLLTIPFGGAKFVTLIIYFAAMMLQVTTYCWYGNEVILESTRISEACFQSSWEELDIEQRKLLLLLMLRSQTPVKITANKFFALSLPTLMAILRSSYSYFALLQRLYKDMQ